MSISESFYTTRVLTKEDINLAPELEEIELKSMKNAWNLQYLIECFDDTYRIIGLFAGKKIIGFSVIFATRFTTDLLTIGVLPEYQGKKLGAKLLLSTLREALNCGAVECFLEVRKSNIVAQNLYKKFSFIISGERKEYYNPIGDEPAEDAFTMNLENIEKNIQR